MGDNLTEARDQLKTAIAEVERVDKENAALKSRDEGRQTRIRELLIERDALLAQVAAVRANAEIWAGSDADQIAPSRGLGLVTLGLLDSAGPDTLAAHDAEVAAKALEEAAEYHRGSIWLRARAAEIRAKGGI